MPAPSLNIGSAGEVNVGQQQANVLGKGSDALGSHGLERQNDPGTGSPGQAALVAAVEEYDAIAHDEGILPEAENQAQLRAQNPLPLVSR